MKKILIFLIILSLSSCITLTPRQEEIVVVVGSSILYGMTISIGYNLVEQ